MNSYTFYVTAENQVGTATNTSEVFVPEQHERKWNLTFLNWDTLNYTVKFRGIYTVGWKYRRKTPNTVG
jgi:hypothetical protein